MSIMRRHSHGCHRLHNHIAVRLMSFVLAHRPHQRKGQEPLSFMKTLVYEDETYEINIKQGGYVFVLDKPLKVEVLEGRIRGEVKQPIEFTIPKFNENYGAYVGPDGGAVEVHGDKLVPVPLPPLIDGGVPLEIDPYEAASQSGTAPTPTVPSAHAAGAPGAATAATPAVPRAKVPTLLPTKSKP
jgi:hypothetical protein